MTRTSRLGVIAATKKVTRIVTKTVLLVRFSDFVRELRNK